MNKRTAKLWVEYKKETDEKNVKHYEGLEKLSQKMENDHNKYWEGKVREWEEENKSYQRELEDWAGASLIHRMFNDKPRKTFRAMCKPRKSMFFGVMYYPAEVVNWENFATWCAKKYGYIVENQQTKGGKEW